MQKSCDWFSCTQREHCTCRMYKVHTYFWPLVYVHLQFHHIPEPLVCNYLPGTKLNFQNQKGVQGAKSGKSDGWETGLYYCWWILACVQEVVNRYFVILESSVSNVPSTACYPSIASQHHSKQSDILDKLIVHNPANAKHEPPGCAPGSWTLQALSCKDNCVISVNFFSVWRVIFCEFSVWLYTLLLLQIMILNKFW